MEQNVTLSLRSDSPDDHPSPTRPQIEAELARVLSSRQLRNAPVLQSLLQFIAQRALDSGGSDLNEHSIAEKVFGRSADFDSSVDTIVRTQAYRLRLKLNEYYGSDGAADPIEIEIPKGHYVPSFHSRSPRLLDPAPVELPQLPHPRTRVRPHWYVTAFVIGVCFVSGLIVGRTAFPARNSVPQPNEVDSFWLNFLGSDRQPVVAYTNSVFLATDTGDLLRFLDGPVSSRGAVVSQDTATKGAANLAVLKYSGETYYEDDMTGVGEVAGAVAITKALDRLGAHPVFKRSRLISASDLEGHNVIFLGSPFVNQILNDLPTKPGFLFKLQELRPPLWSGTIVNSRPRTNELPAYAIERAPGTRILRSDYGLVSQLPGLSSGRKLIVLAGLTTTGTQAAAEFATSIEGVRAMSARLPTKQWPPAFDYLLRVTLNNGVDIIRSECIAARP